LNIEDINGWNAETMHTGTPNSNEVYVAYYQTEKNILNLVSTLKNRYIFNRSIESKYPEWDSKNDGRAYNDDFQTRRTSKSFVQSLY
jgi:hypothetical protein